MFKNDEKILCLERHILVTWKIYLFRIYLVSPKETKKKMRTDPIPVIISDSEGIFWFLQFEIFFKVSVSVLPISINNMENYGESFPLYCKGLNFLDHYFSSLHNLCEVGICDVANWLKKERKLTKNLDVSFSRLQKKDSVFYVYPLKPPRPSYFAVTPLGS